MTRAERRHERYVRRMQATRLLSDVHGLVDLARRIAVTIGALVFLGACAFAGFYIGQVMHP